MPQLYFHSEEVEFNLLSEDGTAAWVQSVISQEGAALQELNFIFCSDEYLHQINVNYLNHDTFTDIITFDHSDQEGSIEGDIFISIDRVAENAKTLNNPFEDELDRVLIHGVLHLLGYEDKTEAQKQVMRKKEEACLSLRPYRNNA